MNLLYTLQFLLLRGKICNCSEPTVFPSLALNNYIDYLERKQP